ncbi:MAG: hypothetical protein KFF68_13800 [Desulfosarcina sp.]|nr:hypothetical protein [Desulfosarcina sp.]
MQPTAYPLDVNAPYKCSFQARWSRLIPKARSKIAAAGKLTISSARLLLMVVLLQLFGGCVSLAYYEGDYHGKVIDADTLQPIEGAVVLGVWWLEYGTAGGPVNEYYDARETMTDENGEFTIKGMGPRAMTHLQKMDIVIIKVGYGHLDRSTWEELKTDERIRWKDEKAIIPLKKLQVGQSRRRFIPYVGSDVPINKQRLLREEVNKQIHGTN